MQVTVIHMVFRLKNGAKFFDKTFLKSFERKVFSLRLSNGFECSHG